MAEKKSGKNTTGVVYTITVEEVGRILDAEVTQVKERITGTPKQLIEYLLRKL